MRSCGLVLALLLLRLRFGEAIDIKDFPYIVSILRNSSTDEYICGGTLITDSWVITTSRCLPDCASRIRYGDIYGIPEMHSEIIKKTFFPNTRIVNTRYSVKNAAPRPRANDIGLAKVENVPNVHVGHISSVIYVSLIGHTATYFESLRNLLRRQIPKRPPKGYKKLVPTRSKQEKQKFEKSLKSLEAKNGLITKCPLIQHPGPSLCLSGECVVTEKNGDPFQGSIWPDFGTPLVLEKKIIGIMSNYLGYYTYYTPVSPYIEWIHEETMHEHLPKPNEYLVVVKDKDVSNSIDD